MIPQMFDVKPVDETGCVDVEKIRKVVKILKLRDEALETKKLAERKARIIQLVRQKEQTQKDLLVRKNIKNIIPGKARSYQLGRPVSREQEVPFLIKSNYRPIKKVAFRDVSPKRETALEEFFGPAKNRDKIHRNKIEADHDFGLVRTLAANKSAQNQGVILPKRDAKKFQTKTNPYITDFDPVLFENYFGVPNKKETGFPKNLSSEGNKLNEHLESEELKGAYSELKASANQESLNYDEILQSNSVKEEIYEKAANKEEIAGESTPVKPKKTEKKKRKKKRGEESQFLGYLFSNYKKISKNIHRRSGLKSKMRFPVLQPALSFAVMLCFVSVFVLSGLIVSRGMALKGEIMVKGQSAVGYIAEAKTDLENQDFESAGKKLDNAKQEFEEAEKEIVFLGGDALDIFSSLPYVSKISTGKNLVEAGKLLVQAGKEMAITAQIFSQINNPFGENQNQNGSLTDVMLSANGHISNANVFLSEAKQSLDNVSQEDLPSEFQGKFEKIKTAIPMIINTISGFEQNYQIFLDILGHNGPRKYLFLFQNNQEMRATGGFIGSYGILDINDGHIRNLFIDGIFNPDGQLSERVVPPKPVQKVSAVWTMHDSNWFPNFPTSAEKAAWFYEKTGGPTVDGVIALTPTVMQKMLEITGPIEMPEYETTVDKDNFIEKTQYEVEIDYDKELNKPKQFIADLAPKILDKVFSVKNPEQISKVFKILAESLKEKHILIYSNNFNLQKIISDQGWSGEILQTSKDYLMVVNSNINGYKTDGVIDEAIFHKAEIQPDGSIIDTVKIKRVHNGGDGQFEWWNKVNADYMRVYAPKGSRLISVKGQTREFNQPPIDYDQLGFRRDAQVQKEELSMEIDEETGTRIYEEENKTVFANWVYVSPKESVELEYQYLLPFRIDLNSNKDNSDGYSLLIQKQSGSTGSAFESEVSWPESDMDVVWKYPEKLELAEKNLKFSDNLGQDRFYGAVFQPGTF